LGRNPDLIPDLKNLAAVFNAMAADADMVDYLRNWLDSEGLTDVSVEDLLNAAANMPLPIIAPPAVASNPFAGNYQGTYSGDMSGTIDAQIFEDGSVVFTTSEPNTYYGSVSIDGNLNAGGSASGGSVTVDFTGSFTSQMSANGNWASSAGYSGTWQINKIYLN